MLKTLDRDSPFTFRSEKEQEATLVAKPEWTGSRWSCKTHSFLWCELLYKSNVPRNKGPCHTCHTGMQVRKHRSDSLTKHSPNLGNLFRSISLLSPAVNVLKSIILTKLFYNMIINTVSGRVAVLTALTELTTHMSYGLNQRTACGRLKISAINLIKDLTRVFTNSYWRSF